MKKQPKQNKEEKSHKLNSRRLPDRPKPEEGLKALAQWEGETTVMALNSLAEES